VLAQAVLGLFPGTKFAIGPAIDNGFYYDFELSDGAAFSDDDLERIDAAMRAIIAADQAFTREECDTSSGLEVFADQPYKREIIERVDASEISGDGTVSLYRNDGGFVDLCRGPHVPSTGRLGHFALQKVAGAYWRGDETRPMLQRIYGTAWESDAALKAHLERLAEAEARDHRRLASELDLISFPEELGGGLAVWHPKGAMVRKLMEDYSRQRHEEGGYQFVVTPHLANGHLFETSGHLDFYRRWRWTTGRITPSP
jgi:threonyl-tRNA synthetase